MTHFLEDFEKRLETTVRSHANPNLAFNFTLLTHLS